MNMWIQRLRSRALLIMLIPLLCVASVGRVFLSVELNLHSISAPITATAERFCGEEIHCLSVDHHHLDIDSMSDTTHAFLHALDAMDGKIMVSILSTNSMWMGSHLEMLLLLSEFAPTRSPLFRPPR